ncbi:porin [Duganella sp. HH105]|uniref:porin n=1 Tax=Duganella sp. HH105 TaxID=1781067 RepID=UPI000877D5F4|nr:porin [Duganella sp. HH105]OEZ55502.1 outer membrane porin protein 32 precursor [Duganella sp. HH105]
MNKQLLAAALCAGCAGAALAQSNVAIYGVLDVGVATVSGATAGSSGFNGNDTKMQSGTLQGSRIGFKGAEDLGNGLSAIFTLESGILADTGASDQGGLLFGRQAFVGIKSNTLGAITLGRQYGPEYLAWKLVEPMDDGFAGAGSNLFATNGKRINNAVKYTTPTVGGVTADVLYGFGEVAGNNAASRDIGASVTYAGGPVLFKAGYNSLNNATASDKSTNYVLSGSYNFQVLKAIVIYGSNKGSGSTDNRDLLLGASIPFGTHTLLASYIRKDDKSSADKDAHQIAVTWTYDMSKRTIAYLSAARMTNKNGAAYHTYSATLPAAGQAGAVAGTREFNVGLRHAF